MGDIGAGALLTGGTGVAKTLLGKAVTGGTVAATEAGMQYASSDEERSNRMGVSGAIGAALPLVGKILSKTGDALVPGGDMAKYFHRMFSAKKAAVQDLAYNVKSEIGDDISKLTKSTDAAEKVGAELTPGQAIGGKILPAKESAKAISDESKRLVRKRVGQQESAALSKLDDTMADMTPKGIQKSQETVNNLYTKLDKLEVTDDVLDTVKGDVNLTEVLDSINTGAESGVKHLADNSFTKMNKIKKVIDSRLYNSRKAIDPEKILDPDVARALRESRAKLMKSMDKEGFGKDYSEVLELGSRIKTRLKYLNILGKKTKGPRQDGVSTVDESYAALFNTKPKQDQFIADVRKTGGDPEQAKNVIKTLDQLRDSPLGKLLKKQDSKVAAGGGENTVMGAVKSFLDNLTLGRYNDAVLKLNLSGNKWKTEVGKVLALPEKSESRNMAMLKLLTKIMGKGVKPAVATKTAKVFVDEPEKKKQGYLNK